MESFKQNPKYKKNPILEYLKKINKEGGKPHMLAFKKHYNHEDYSYNIKSFNINQNFAKAFSENLKTNTKLNSLVMVRTNLSDESLEQLIVNIPRKLQRLDISYNTQLTVKGYRSLKENFLFDEKRTITYLNFEGNMMGDESCKEVCEGI